MRLIHTTLVILLAIISILGCKNTVWAKEDDNNGAAIPAADMKERIDFIQTSFNRGQFRARLWSYGWMGLFAGMAGYQTYAAVRTSTQRTYNIVGASESFLALFTMIVFPFSASGSGDDLRVLPEHTAAERENKLEKGEAWLENGSRQQKFGRSYVNHLINLGIALGGACIVLANDGYRPALINGVSTFLGGEIRIWTQPTDAVEASRMYKRNYTRDATGHSMKIEWFVSASPLGIVAGVNF